MGTFPTQLIGLTSRYGQSSLGRGLLSRHLQALSTLLSQLVLVLSDFPNRYYDNGTQLNMTGLWGVTIFFLLSYF